MTEFIKILLTAIFGAIIDTCLKVLRKSPEEKAKEKYDKKINEAIERIDSDDPGYKLPVGTSDKWGETITTKTRLESGPADGAKRPTS